MRATAASGVLTRASQSSREKGVLGCRAPGAAVTDVPKRGSCHQIGALFVIPSPTARLLSLELARLTARIELSAVARGAVQSRGSPVHSKALRAARQPAILNASS